MIRRLPHGHPAHIQGHPIREVTALQTRRTEGDGIAAGVVYGILAALIWGAWPVVTRMGVQQSLGPADITALRFAVAGLLLLPLVWRRGVAGVGWPLALLLAFGAGVPYVLVTAVGLSIAPAGHGGVIIPSCMLTFSMLGSWRVLGDRPDRMRLIGYAVIIAGVVMIGWQGLTNGGTGAWRGDLLFVLGGLLWATYTVASRLRGADPLHATALVSVISMVLYLPVYLLFGEPRIFTAPLEETLFQALCQGLFAGILALLFYTRAVAALGAARGAVFAALVPGITVLLAFPALGEVPTWRELLGVVTVSVGMVYALALHRLGRLG